MGRKRKASTTPVAKHHEEEEEKVLVVEKQEEEEEVEEEVEEFEEVEEEVEEEFEEEEEEEEEAAANKENMMEEEEKKPEEEEEEEEEEADKLEKEEEQVLVVVGENELEEEEESVEKLIEPFSKQQLALLVKEAASKFPDFIHCVRKLADADPAHRKIFVHGLGWDTNAEILISQFSKFGEVEDCKAVVDKASGKSKGYAFILFKHRSGAHRALKDPQKKIGNRITSCQLASAGPVPAPPPAAPPVSEYTQRKIFVSNVAEDIDPAKLTEFFAKFGEIEDGPLGLDKNTRKPRGFALFVYKSIDSAKNALEEPHKTFEGHTLHCQRAIDGPKPNKQQQTQHQHFQHYHHQGQGGYHPHHAAKKAKYSTSGGHLMAPSAGPPAATGFNPAAVPPPGALAPALGQALTALFATQGATGLGNLLGGLGNPQGMPPPVMNHHQTYGNHQGPAAAGRAYGTQMQPGYPNPQMGTRPPQGGGGYMGHGH